MAFIARARSWLCLVCSDTRRPTATFNADLLSCFSEYPANREIYFRLARGADAFAQGHWADDGLRNHSQIDAAADYHRAWVVEGASRFQPSSPVNSFSDERRQVVEVSTEAEGGIGIVVRPELVRQISSEAERSPKPELLNDTGIAVKRRSS